MCGGHLESSAGELQVVGIVHGALDLRQQVVGTLDLGHTLKWRIIQIVPILACKNLTQDTTPATHNTRARTSSKARSTTAAATVAEMERMRSSLGYTRPAAISSSVTHLASALCCVLCVCVVHV